MIIKWFSRGKMDDMRFALTLTLLLLAAIGQALAQSPAKNRKTPEAARAEATATTHTAASPAMDAPAKTSGNIAQDDQTRTTTTQNGIGKTVYVIPVEGEFEKALYLIMVRAMRRAEQRGASLIILDMNTPGGRVDSAIKIRD